MAILHPELLVLLDAKGIEGHYEALFEGRPEVLARRLKDSAIDAVDQAIATLAALPAGLRRPSVVFLCVTYKQINLGTGNKLRSLIGADEDMSPRWSDPALTPERMFFVSIQELEVLAGAVRQGQDLAQILNQVLDDNRDAHRANFQLLQHLARYGSVPFPAANVAAFREVGGW